MKELLFIILGGLIGLSLGHSICPEGFVLFYPDPRVPMPTCILFAMDQKRTWYEALNYCDSINTQLARLDNSQLHFQIIDYIFGREAWRHEGFHIGCSDEYKEGEWLWLNGDPVPLGLPHWLPGQPDGGRRENYGCLYPPGFYYNSCLNGEKLYAICKV